MMQHFEYRVVPAPRRGEKARGVKTTEERFALALTALMNQMASDGWEYVRADTLPCDERAGLTGTKTSYQNMLVFCRRSEPATPESSAPRLDPELAAGGPVPLVHAASPLAERLPVMRLGAPIAPSGSAPPVGPARSGHPVDQSAE